jgi:hypothetical protein
MSPDAVTAALVAADATQARHHVEHCPRCRKALKIPIDQLRRHAPLIIPAMSPAPIRSNSIKEDKKTMSDFSIFTPPPEPPPVAPPPMPLEPAAPAVETPKPAAKAPVVRKPRVKKAVRKPAKKGAKKVAKKAARKPAKKAVRKPVKKAAKKSTKKKKK